MHPIAERNLEWLLFQAMFGGSLIMFFLPKRNSHRVMIPGSMRNFWILFLLSVTSGSVLSANSSSTADVSIKTLLSGVLETRHKILPEGEGFQFVKTFQMQWLKANGQVDEEHERVYSVLHQGASLLETLIQVDGKELTEEERSKETTKEKKLRARWEAPMKGPSGDGASEWSVDDLMKRYEWTREEHSDADGMLSWELIFRPLSREDASDSFPDSLLNRLKGSIWIDPTDQEWTTIKIELTESFSIGFLGLIGSIKAFEMQSSRIRMPSGSWLEKERMIEVSGRKLWSPLRMRILESMDEFHEIP